MNGDLAGVRPTQMQWPHLYRVTLFGLVDGQELSLVALSWFDDKKAVAMAAEEHRRRSVNWWIYAVRTDDLGPAPRSGDGTVGQGPPGYLEDRMEF